MFTSLTHAATAKIETTKYVVQVFYFVKIFLVRQRRLPSLALTHRQRNWLKPFVSLPTTVDLDTPDADACVVMPSNPNKFQFHHHTKLKYLFRIRFRVLYTESRHWLPADRCVRYRRMWYLSHLHYFFSRSVSFTFTPIHPRIWCYFCKAICLMLMRWDVCSSARISKQPNNYKKQFFSVSSCWIIKAIYFSPIRT